MCSFSSVKVEKWPSKWRRGHLEARPSHVVFRNLERMIGIYILQGDLIHVAV